MRKSGLPSPGLIARVLMVATAAGLGAGVLRIGLQYPRVFLWREFLEVAAINAIYAWCIAIPATLGLRQLSARLKPEHNALLLPSVLITLFVSCAIGCMAAGGVVVLLGIAPLSTYWEDWRSSATFAAVLTIGCGMSMWIYEILGRRLEETNAALRLRQMEEERARALLAEARLSSLEARIHPHFLFNTLNSVAAMIPKDPQRAERMILQVASLLRFSLQASQAGLVPLSQELKIVRDYLELQKARFGNRLRYRVEVATAFDDVPVPPLSIESLVENSIKYAIDPSPSGGEILVTAGTLDDGTLEIAIRDSGSGFLLEEIPAGHGIENLRDRLDLSFGSRGRLAVESDSAGCVVKMTVPARCAREVSV